jgi:hypothetical protein
MTDNVVFLHETTTLDIPPDRVLESAIGTLDGVVLLGYAKDGGEYFASSYGDDRTVLWLLEKLKARLLNK